ncbi:MAG: quinol oxidase [Candidatus Eisenbacteria bacterium]|uniref:Quinol oxidase n=1 Tax=Eiseniibacteriota bacterium TaxID=2212470 RepID=A0A538U2F9_UNCEI|nr:MAG: quinol oxidase [Candidatus Eisenbacteria bacterium]
MRQLVFVALCVAATGCASGLNRPVREVTAATGSDRIQRVTVTTHSFYFDPNRIVLKRGVPVELTIKNAAWFVPHDFSCDAKEAGIDVDARLGMFHGSKRVSFTPTQAGEFHFHCDVDGHAKKGMTGMLVVKD